ncbi:lactate utilization protein C [Streptomyces sp. NPDC051636]|uniref:lactate utilization protein C n=1 Tax=Streptomyces sp. NPDC051636 TaxID=3365663 RepID=UPI0037ABBEC1
MNARTEVLSRIRRALTDVPEDERPEDVPVTRAYARSGTAAAGSTEAVELLMNRLADYGASVRLVAEGAVPTAIAQTLTARGAACVVVPQGFPPSWQTALDPLRVLDDRPRVPVRELDRVDSVVTTAAVAIAETGTLVLDGGPGQGRRALTLVPDHHVCVLRAEQVVARVPEALARLDPVRPLTFVSGPSATSDIELDRVEGVHGPRTLHALVVV